MQTFNLNKGTIRADFHKVNELFVYFLKGDKNEGNLLQEFYADLISSIPKEIQIKILTDLSQEEKLPVTDRNIQELSLPTGDIWLKDYIGFIGKKRMVRPIYQPNYCSCKMNEEESKKLNEDIERLITESLNKAIVKLPLVWDCSNIATNGKIAFISSKILSDNPDKQKEEIEAVIQSELGVKPIIIGVNKFDSIGQISSYIQFLNKTTVAISQYPDKKEFEYDNSYLESLVSKAKEEGLDVVRLKEMPSNSYSLCLFSENKKKCTLSSKGTYLNLLVLNDTAILPFYSSIKEDWECNEYNKQILTPYFENVVQINCDALAEFGGVLNSICFSE